MTATKDRTTLPSVEAYDATFGYCSHCGQPLCRSVNFNLHRHAFSLCRDCAKAMAERLNAALGK
jgi:RNA polymerase-binding transcription factor DksA